MLTFHFSSSYRCTVASDYDMRTWDFKRIPSDAFRTSPALPAITSVHFVLFRITPCSLVLRTLHIQSPYHLYLIRTASEHFPMLLHHVHSLAALSLSIAFLSWVSFCFASVRIPCHYHYLYVHITSTSSPSISGLTIIIIPSTLLTSRISCSPPCH